jgi:hypothetical protein
MKKLLLFCLLILSTQILFSQVRVSGYTRKNGTYVQPHMRSSPNSNPYDNYSFPGNTNPYTGKTSTGNPDTYLDNYYNKNNGNRPISSSSNNIYSYPNSSNQISTNSNSVNKKNEEDTWKKYKIEEDKKRMIIEKELDNKINQFKIISKKIKPNENN